MNQPTEIQTQEDTVVVLQYIPRHYIFTESFKPNPYQAGTGTKGKKHRSQKIRLNKRKHG